MTRDPALDRVVGEMNQRIAAMFADFEQDQMRAEQAAAKADPAKHKLSKVMPPGVKMNYHHWGAIKDKRGRKISFCWTTHRNVAGYFVGWREIETPVRRKRKPKPGEAVATIRRDQWCARRIRTKLEQLQKRRTDALRAKYPPPPKKQRWWISEKNPTNHCTYGLGWVRADTEEGALKAAAKRWSPNRPDRAGRERKAERAAG